MKKEQNDHGSSQELTEQESASAEHAIRVGKVERLKEQSIPAWPAGKPVSASCEQVVSKYAQDKDETVEYTVAGRLMSFREHGKTAFGNIQDRSGRLQLYIRKDAVGDEAFEWIKDYIDVGDIIWCRGTVFTTRTGETTLKVIELRLLSKCLHPLPEKFHGLADIETIYRQRYLDLISNQESRERFVARSKIIRLLREMLEERGFVEVETPMLHPIPGGATARPFVTHHNALDTTLYMRIAPELYLKRLVVGGIERVYEINRNFRNEGISTRHNPEFTMLEYYEAYQDYHNTMDYLEMMLRTIAKEVCGTLQVPYAGKKIDFEKPFERLSMQQAVAQYGDISLEDLEPKTIDATLKKHNITLEKGKDAWGQKLVALFEELVEPKLFQPIFVTDFPIEVSPLAKRDPNNPHLAARFELFIGGMELSNGFNELNDPFDQSERFKEQAQALSSGDVEAHHYDADYIQALEYALPPTVGCGVGIDRLAMLLTNTTSIKDVILFPTLKPKK